MDNLKLEEIIWEVTLKCGKNCKYCGSKDVIRPENPQKKCILHIAQEIADYKVNIVTLSGGEPGQLSDQTLEEVVQILKSGGCSVRAVTNGKLLKGAIAKEFDIIGLSVNDSLDLPQDLMRYDDLTMITNFGTHNIFSFDKLAEIAKNFNTWQIQLTMGEFLLSSEGITYLKEKIRNLPTTIKYILSDNLQDQHICSAGIHSCGITTDGDIIPCLSERSICHNEDLLSVQGNLFQRTLKDIWENEFKDIRFSDKGWTYTCRNCINYPEVKVLTPVKTIESWPPTTYPNSAPETPDFDRVTVTVYGVDSNRTIAYGTGERGGRGRYSPYSGGNVYSYGVTSWRAMGVTSHSEQDWR
jgi:radical SAM protein with 4Fe4S-binding SPASM domain